jgi:hypothetical protein
LFTKDLGRPWPSDLPLCEILNPLLNYFFKHILLYFFISIIVIIVFTIYLKFPSYSSGGVGMVRFIAVNSLLTIGVTSLILLIENI